MDEATLRVEFVRTALDEIVFRCIRPDESLTWQKQKGANARFFPLHDLTHFAVERVLGATHGFYGLIASGWDIADTTGKGVRGPLPDEALEIEYLVGIFDAERASGIHATTDELRGHVTAFIAAHNLNHRFDLTDQTIEAIRSLRTELHAEWSAVEPGGKLVLELTIARPCQGRASLR